MSLETWLAFVAASLLLTMTPGPSILLGMVHSLHFGARRTLFTALGDVSANMIQMILVAIGLGVVLAHSALAFQIIKWTGVGVLLYMGWRAWHAPALQKPEPDSHLGGQPTRLFTAGFLVAFSNPKALVFFTAFFPQFIDPERDLVTQLMLMCPTMTFLDFLFVMLYAAGANGLAGHLKQHPKALNRVSGSVLISAAGLMGLMTQGS